MKNRLSIRQIRTLFFLVGIGFHLTSFILYPQNRQGGNFVSTDFYDLFGLIALIPAFSYRIDEEALLIHTLIERHIKIDPLQAHLRIGIAFAFLTLFGAYLSYRSAANQGYISQGNFGLFKILLFLLWFTFSFWERRQQLKE